MPTLDTNPQLGELLAELPHEDRVYASAKPGLLKIFETVMRMRPALTTKDLGYLIDKHRDNPHVFNEFEVSKFEDKEVLLSSIMRGQRSSSLSVAQSEINRAAMAASDFNEGKKQARLGLAAYYFDGDDKHTPAELQRSIRYDRFASPVFDNKSLPRILTSSELLAGAMVVYQQPLEEIPETHSGQAAEFIKDYSGPVDKKLVDQLRASFKVKKPIDLYNAIFSIKDINLSLATDLFKAAAKDYPLPNLSKVSESPLKEWLFNQNASMIREKAERYLATIKFGEHLATIDNNIKDLRRRGYSETEGVLDRTIKMRDALISDKENYLITGNQEQFKASSIRHITGHLEILEQHRGIKQIITPLVNGLLEMLAAFQLISQSQLKSGLHSMKTTSAQAVSELKEKLDDQDSSVSSPG